MIAEEVKRKTAKIHADLEEVKMDNDGAVVAVATAVQELNQTTAVHAAWTEERFDAVDQRLDSLEKGQCDIRSAMVRMEAGIREDMRVRENTLVWHMSKIEMGLRQDMSNMEDDIRVLKTDVGVLKVDVAELRTDVSLIKTDVAELKTDVSLLKTDVAEMKTDVTAMRGDISQLGVRIEQVLAFAIRDETNVDGIADEVAK